MSKLHQIGADDVETIARGATVLGTGGGGDPYIGRLMAQRAILDNGPVPVVGLADVPDDAFIFLIGMMGAPTVIVEKLPSGKEAAHALNSLSSSLDRKITHVGCVEAGGINSMIPIAAAAQARLPLIDADGMGRAFPELQMLIPTLEGVANTPMALTDEKGNTLIIHTVDNHSAEAFARPVTVQMGASATMALFPMTGTQFRAGMIPSTLSLAYDIGKRIEDARRQHIDPVAEVVSALSGFEIFRGKAVDVLRRTTAGFVRGEAKLDGIGKWTGHEMVLEFQNEFLAARRDGEFVCSTPDLICVLDAQTGEPVTADGMSYGSRIAVIGAPCFDRWRSPEGLRIVGPRYFGYDYDFVPVEKLHLS